MAQFCERKWWKFYIKAKNTEQYLLWKKEYWRQLMLVILPHLPQYFKSKLKIADIGCGPSGIFLVLEEYFNEPNITAIDPLISYYQTLSLNFPQQNIQYVTQKLEDNHSQNKYDIVFCINAINHVEHINIAINHLMSLTKSKGYIIFTTDAHNKKWLSKIFQMFPGDILHPQQLMLKEYLNYFRNCTIIHQQTLAKNIIFEYKLCILQVH